MQGGLAAEEAADLQVSVCSRTLADRSPTPQLADLGVVWLQSLMLVRAVRGITGHSSVELLDTSVSECTTITLLLREATVQGCPPSRRGHMLSQNWPVCLQHCVKRKLTCQTKFPPGSHEAQGSKESGMPFRRAKSFLAVNQAPQRAVLTADAMSVYRSSMRCEHSSSTGSQPPSSSMMIPRPQGRRRTQARILRREFLPGHSV